MGEKWELIFIFIFLGSKITVDGDSSHEIKTNLNNILKNRDITWLTKVCTIKAMVFPVVMDGYKSWTIRKLECWSLDAFKLWCWRTLKSPLDSKEIKPVNPKVHQPWIFIGRTDAEAEALILWPPDRKSWHIWKGVTHPDAGKDWRQQEKGITEDAMVR